MSQLQKPEKKPQKTWPPSEQSLWLGKYRDESTELIWARHKDLSSYFKASYNLLPDQLDKLERTFTSLF